MFKIHSARLRSSKWNLTLPLAEARRNDEIISLASSQVLRWIDELNGVTDADARAREIKTEIKRLRREEQSQGVARSIKKLYADLDRLQFKPDYMCLVIDKNSDYIRACKGFSINGVKYTRLLGTPGGIKMSTIVFVSEQLSGELRRRISNDRNQEKAFIPAKLEAYRALTCSASTPVRMPHGVLVVNDIELTFDDNVISLSNDGGAPVISEPHIEPVTITASDGCGMILPSLAELWSEDLRLSYTLSGCCIRMAWTKGMVYTFPFDEFAELVAGRYVVKDAWGDDVDIRDVDLVLPVSMVKLWDSYSSCAEWLDASKRNGYTFAVTKVCAKELESERALNYQFEQVFDLTDEDVDELVAPTIDEINGALCGDWAKTVLYLKGTGLNEQNVLNLDNDWQKALMVEPRLIDDPFVRSSIHSLIKKRIDEAKVGVLKVHGNYSTASGDLYALCQGMFGMEITGLLKAGEIYNHFWADTDAEELLAFRAPMSCAENARRVIPSRDEDVLRWFRYMTACTVVSAHDNMMGALNGMDFDGDLVMLTDNPVLLRRQTPLPTLMCAQKKGEKKIPTEEDFIRSNIASFGNDVGSITNKGTSMYEVASKFDKSSEEYAELRYRIRGIQAIQQESIDKAKGIVATPMPRFWYDRHAIGGDMTEENKKFLRSIVADRKPYFMRYIYPSLSKEYTKYIRDTNKNAMRRFRMSVDELMSMPSKDLTDQQLEFLQRYRYYMPVGTGDCTMNRICRRVEREYDKVLSKKRDEVPFDYTILRGDSDYSVSHMRAIKKLMDEYDKIVRDRVITAERTRVKKEDRIANAQLLDDIFREACASACPNKEELCEILIDLCYTKEKSKQFVWRMCGDDIVKKLMKKNKSIQFPTKSDGGDIEWMSESFEVASVQVDVVE